MRLRFRTRALLAIVPVAALIVSCGGGAGGEAPATPSAATATPADTAATANVQQVMRGVLFTNSNVVFAAQADDPDKVPKEKDPSTAVNPLASTYGGWEAVGNSALALTESARLLEVPRTCANGTPAPVTSETWKKGLSELRAGGLAAYQAAQAKNQDGIVDAADKVTTACSTCHEAYREKTPRCV